MARSPATFRQRDLTRAIRGAVSEGVNIARIEIDKTGKITIVAGSSDAATVQSSNPWDQVLNHEPN